MERLNLNVDFHFRPINWPYFWLRRFRRATNGATSLPPSSTAEVAATTTSTTTRFDRMSVVSNEWNLWAFHKWRYAIMSMIKSPWLSILKTKAPFEMLGSTREILWKHSQLIKCSVTRNPALLLYNSLKRVSEISKGKKWSFEDVTWTCLCS